MSLAHSVTKERGCPPPCSAGSSVGYMVCKDRRVHLPSCQIIYMTIRILLKMLVSNWVSVDNNVNNGGSLYGKNDDDNDEDKE